MRELKFQTSRICKKIEFRKIEILLYSFPLVSNFIRNASDYLNTIFTNSKLFRGWRTLFYYKIIRFQSRRTQMCHSFNISVIPRTFSLFRTFTTTLHGATSHSHSIWKKIKSVDTTLTLKSTFPSTQSPILSM